MPVYVAPSVPEEICFVLRKSSRCSIIDPPRPYVSSRVILRESLILFTPAFDLSLSARLYLECSFAEKSLSKCCSRGGISSSHTHNSNLMPALNAPEEAPFRHVDISSHRALYACKRYACTGFILF